MALDNEILARFDLAGKVAVVTGAGSGLGQESARILALAGAAVILTDINPDGLRQTAATIHSVGGRAEVEPLDVTQRDAVEALADTVADRHGRLDVWLNSAGLPLVAPIVATTAVQAETVIAVNMMGCYWGCAAAGRVMQRFGGGSIINISSGGGENPVPGLSLYGMTKAAVNQLTRTAAHEFGPAGIRVNAIAPAWIETPMGTALFRDEAGNINTELQEQVRQEQAAANPLHRNCKAMDIAMAVLYLASDAGNFISAQIWQVNGGAHS